jgi:undecaprenyl-diphosphatase
MLFGFLLRDVIGSDFRSLYVIAWSLIGLALTMAVAESLAKHLRPLEDVRAKDGLVVGLFQTLALVPGVSRSGSTITGALFLGFDRESAARLSFLLSIPAILIAGIFELVTEADALRTVGLGPTVSATFAAFISGYISIGFLLRFLRTRSTLAFIAYRIVLGVLLLALLSQGVLDAN